jgi:hypothetical protein
MTFKELVDNMIACGKKHRPRLKQPHPVPDETIEKAEKSFQKKFGYGLPDAYKRLLRRANGIIYNGLIVWPATPQTPFEETIEEANTNLQEDFCEDFLYFGESGEELYVFDLKAQQYCAIEYVGKACWKEFEDAEEMIQYMLARAWE